MILNQRDYIKIIESMSTTINRLPRRASHAIFKNDDSSDSHSEEITQIMGSVSMQKLVVLLGVMNMLNDHFKYIYLYK